MHHTINIHNIFENSPADEKKIGVEDSDAI